MPERGRKMIKDCDFTSLLVVYPSGTIWGCANERGKNTCGPKRKNDDEREGWRKRCDGGTEDYYHTTD